MKNVPKIIVSITLLALLFIVAPTHIRAQGAIVCDTDVVVQADDWLSKIAEKFYGDPLAFPAIAEATNVMSVTDDSYAIISNVDVIEPGWKLCIPSTEDAQAILSTSDAPEEIVSTAPDEPLLLLEWSGYEATAFPQFFTPFTTKYADVLNDTVDYSFFAEDAEAFAKMQTGIGADLVHPCRSWWQLYVDAGLVQPIDTSRLSNWASLHPGMVELGQFNGEQYFVPWDWGYESILVRTDLVEEVPDSWGDLWDEQYAGHVIFWDSGQTAYFVAANVLGMEDIWDMTPEKVEAAKQKLIELKPNLLTYWADFTEAYDLPATGDAWLTANAWQDAYAYLQSDGYEVAYIQPEEGRFGWVCGYGISTDSDQVDLAYEFLDAAISKDSMAALSNEYWYGGANVAALPLIDEYVVEFMELDQPGTLFERTQFYAPLTDEQRKMVTEMWDEVKAAP